MTLFIYPPTLITGGATEATLLDILAAVDGVETLIGTTNTKLDSVIAKDFATSAKQDATNHRLDTLAGYVDGIETLVGSSNTKLDSLIAKDFATEATLAKLKKWPYTTFASITPSEDATNTYYTYKTALAATVGTITTNKSTGVITFSPDKVV